MDGYGGNSVLGLAKWAKKERKVKVAGGRLLSRPAPWKIEKRMIASLKGAC